MFIFFIHSIDPILNYLPSHSFLSFSKYFSLHSQLFDRFLLSSLHYRQFPVDLSHLAQFLPHSNYSIKKKRIQ